jgi:hypothetical protein
MYNYNLVNDNCIKQYDNMNTANKPYRAKNMIVQRSETPSENKNTNQTEPPTEIQPKIKDTPITNTPPIIQEEVPIENPPLEETKTILEDQGTFKTGYISVGAFTALQALPVPDAVVTIYLLNSDGEEDALYILITDENGRIPDVELPVSYNPDDPYSSSEYFFTSYNLRVQAINYYTINVLDVRVFPDIKTVYRIEMIPLMAGDPQDKIEQTIVIPPGPIDESNE